MGHLLSLASQMESLTENDIGRFQLEPGNSNKDAFGGDLQSCDNDTQTPTTEALH